MKRSTRLVLALGFMLLGITSPAGATLIGDTVTSQHFWRSLNKPLYAAQSVIVKDGTTDLMLPDLNLYSVNVEAASILIHFLTTGSFSPGPVNSLKLSDLDDSSGNDLRGATVTTNMSGWALPRLSITAHEVTFNWAGLPVTPDTDFTVNLDFTSPTEGNPPVPEPATLFLLAAGALAFVGKKRRPPLPSRPLS